MLGNSPLIAMILSAVSHILMSLGAVIQKQGADKAPEIGKNPLKTTIMGFLKNKTWLFGATLALIGLPIFLLAFQFEGLIYTQPMVGLGLLTIVIYSQKILKEKISNLEAVGIFLILLTPFIMVYGSNQLTNNILEYDSNLLLFFFLLIYSFTVLLFIFTTKLEKGKKKAVIFAFITGSLLGSAAIYGRLVATQSEQISMFFLFLLMIHIIIGNIIAQIMYQQGRAAVTLTITYFLNLFLPVVAGILILQEKINFLLSIGILMMLLGVVLVSKTQSIIIRKI
jgi:drug/metabolite transporter (DMT)-like permease